MIYRFVQAGVQKALIRSALSKDGVPGFVSTLTFVSEDGKEKVDKNEKHASAYEAFEYCLKEGCDHERGIRTGGSECDCKA